MKKSVINCLFVLIVMTVILLTVGCSEKDVSVYTLKENGVEYTLTLNDTDGTFVLTEKKGDETTEYAGDFTYKDGGVILSSTNFGYRSVRLTGDTFVFIVNPSGMEEITPPCEHEWGKAMHYEGDCSHYGYTERTCKKCKEKEKVIDTAYGEHVSDGGKHVEGKTCTDYGNTVYTCKVCKEVLKTVRDTAPSGRHDYVASETLRDNGCNKVIERLHVCKNCHTETYMEEPSRAIGAHKDADGDGICDVCKRMKNGLPTEHADNDEDGFCDTCKVKMSVLQGVISSPCGYEEDGKTYIGVYPQAATGISARDIKATGLYDKTLDVWYYGTETYVLRTVTSTSGDYTFAGSSIAVNVREEYAFILQPLAFTEVGDMCVCDKIIDADAFLKEYAKINNGMTNVWEESTLYEYLNGEVAARIGCAERIESIDLLAVDELPPAADCIKTITDYALAGGIGFSEQERKGKWFLKTAGSQADKIWCVGAGGIKEEVDVTNIRGIVPVIRLRQGE